MLKYYVKASDLLERLRRDQDGVGARHGRLTPKGGIGLTPTSSEARI
jgi:hypothetical protein